MLKLYERSESFSSGLDGSGGRNKPSEFTHTAWNLILTLVLSFADLFLFVTKPLYNLDANFKG